MPVELLREKVVDAEGLYVTSFDPVDAALMDSAPKLRVVSNYAVGTDNIDLPGATQRGIPAGNTPGRPCAGGPRTGSLGSVRDQFQRSPLRRASSLGHP